MFTKAKKLLDDAIFYLVAPLFIHEFFPIDDWENNDI